MPPELTASDCMQTEVLSVPPSLPMLELENLLVARRIGGVPVVDDGRLVGIISRSDVVKHLTDDLAADAIETEYMWDIGPPTQRRAASSTGASANPATIAETLSNLRVSDLMTEQVVTVDPSLGVSAIAKLMTEQHIHRVVVADGDELVGVVTTLDLTRLLADGRARAER